MSIQEFIFAFLVGAAVYGAIEVMFRGGTHWSMPLTGGVCFVFVYLTAGTNWPLLIKCGAGALFITAMEFTAGCVVNLMLGWDVWDYSGNRCNLLGQICLKFTGFWFLLCFPGVWLANAIRLLF